MCSCGNCREKERKNGQWVAVSDTIIPPATLSPFDCLHLLPNTWFKILLGAIVIIVFATALTKSRSFFQFLFPSTLLLLLAIFYHYWLFLTTLCKNFHILFLSSQKGWTLDLRVGIFGSVKKKNIIHSFPSFQSQKLHTSLLWYLSTDWESKKTRKNIDHMGLVLSVLEILTKPILSIILIEYSNGNM